MSFVPSNSSTAFAYSDVPTSGVYGIIEAMPGVRNMLEYCQLKAGENVVILLEHTVDPVVVQAIAAGVVYHGGHIQLLSVAPFAIGGMKTANAPGLLSKLLETAHLVISCSWWGEVHSDTLFFDKIASSKCRVLSLHMSATVSALATGARFPYKVYEVMESKMYSMLESATEVRLTTHQGTDLMFKHPKISGGGPLRPGMWRPFPYGGANFYSSDVSGIIVCVDSTVTGVPEAPIKITIKDGIVTAIEGDEEGARNTRAFSPTGSYLRHALIGLNPKVRVAGGTQFEREKHSGSFYLGLDGLIQGRPRLDVPGHAHNDIQFDYPTVRFDGKPSGNPVDGTSCKRCLETHCPCIYEETSSEYQRRRAAGAKRKESASSERPWSTAQHQTRRPSPFQDSESPNRCTTTRSAAREAARQSESPSETSQDNVGPATQLKAVSETQSQRLLDHFFSVMTEPPLISPSLLPSADSHRQKDVLRLTVLATAASTLDMKVFAEMDTRLRHTLADLVMVTGQKSIELVQALILAVAFYAANEPLHKVRILGLAAQADSMSSDLGLYEISCQFHTDTGECVNSNDSQCIWTLAGARITTMECHEAMHTSLACLWAVNSVRVLFQRPLLPQYPPCTRSYVTVLGSSTLADHQKIAAWTDLEMIAVASMASSVTNPSRLPENESTRGTELVASLDNWHKTYTRFLDCSKILLLHYSAVRTRLLEPSLGYLRNDKCPNPPFDECVLGGEQLSIMRQEAQRISHGPDISLIHDGLSTAISLSSDDVRAQGIIFFTDICYLFSILINNYLSQALRNIAGSHARQRAVLYDLLDQATALFDSATAEHSNKLHCNARTFRNVLMRLRAKLDKAEVAIARHDRRGANDVEQMVDSIYRERQGQASTMMPVTSSIRGSENMPGQELAILDNMLNGPTAIMPELSDDALGEIIMEFLPPERFHAFDFEGLF
ncbi:hypothetical protein DER46DRAFT_542898 [Fusarium sp. MPI-SDFR-AT-0072]|nr:hypothetical protein DER46DRAFT_542898 [Fusarium sp. MPI-SDFR-AT-0072]